MSLSSPWPYIMLHNTRGGFMPDEWLGGCTMHTGEGAERGVGTVREVMSKTIKWHISHHLQPSASFVSPFVVCSLFFSWTECAGYEKSNKVWEKLQAEEKRRTVHTVLCNMPKTSYPDVSPFISRYNICHYARYFLFLQWIIYVNITFWMRFLTNKMHTLL